MYDHKTRKLNRLPKHGQNMGSIHTLPEFKYYTGLFLAVPTNTYSTHALNFKNKFTEKKERKILKKKKKKNTT